MYLHHTSISREYFPRKDEKFTVDRNVSVSYDKDKQKRFGFVGQYIPEDGTHAVFMTR